MNNPPLHLELCPSPGSSIEDCFDYALRVARQLDLVVTFEFNEVHCGVRPSDYGEPERKEFFLKNYRYEGSKTSGCKICFANP